MKKIPLAIVSLLFLLGAGCTALIPSAPSVPVDATPGVNEENCAKSGGTVDGNECVCPEAYEMDPAGFCLDAQGRPGGEMTPK